MSGLVRAALLGFAAATWASEACPWTAAARAFLEPLTFPDSEWSASDFGKEVPAEDRQRLEAFRPRVVIAPKGLAPIDFYRDYLPWSRLKGGAGDEGPPSRRRLKEVERDNRYWLDFQGEFAPCRGKGCKEAVLYGRIYRESMKPPSGEENRPVEILKYSAVFSASGLPKGLPWYKRLAGGVAGNLRVWHELDIHGAVHLLFERGAPRPFAVLLAQHNHFRTYMVGKDLQWPKDNRLRVCYAQRSNEPYLCPRGGRPARERATGNPKHIRWLVLGGKPPATGGLDIVYGLEAGGVELPARMNYLPDRDPLYVAWIPLGDKQRILGVFKSFYRSGPPGIDMNTWPQMRKYGDIAQFWYIGDGDHVLVELYEANIQGFESANLGPVLEYGAARFWRDWARKPL